MIGRDAELAQLAQAWIAGQVGAVIGQAGMGKSRLLQDFAASRSAVVHVAARPGNAGVPLATLARLLRAVVGRGPQPVDLAPPTRLEIARVLPEFDAALPRLVGEGQRALTEQARLRPMPLRPLNEADLATLVDSLQLPGVDGGTLAPGLLQRTGGNPLFPLETLKQARVERSLHRLANISRLPRPASVGRLIERRIVQLSPGALARVASIAGVDFEIALAEQMPGVSAMQLADALNELEGAHVMCGNALAHDLVFQTVHASVQATIAAHPHGKVAAWLEQHRGEPARIARHWIAARQATKSLPWLQRAADAARQALAAELGAIGIGDHPDLRLQVLIQLADEGERETGLRQLAIARAQAEKIGHRGTVLATQIRAAALATSCDPARAPRGLGRTGAGPGLPDDGRAGDRTVAACGPCARCRRQLGARGGGARARARMAGHDGQRTRARDVPRQLPAPQPSAPRVAGAEGMTPYARCARERPGDGANDADDAIAGAPDRADVPTGATAGTRACPPRIRP